MSDIILTAYDGAFLGPIAKLLGYIMNIIYSFMVNVLGIGNISVTIIIFTIVIYMLLFPITYKQQKFSKLSQKMQPELQKVRKKYQGKKDAASMQAMQDETTKIYEKYGIYLPHSSSAQSGYGTRINPNEAKPIDLFFYGNGGGINHVAMYIGNGQVVHASSARTGIKISNAFYRSPICVTRLISD